MSRQITEELLTPTLRERGQTQREVLEVDAAHWSDIFSNSSYTIPDYQRNYSWEKEQQTDFLDTVITAFNDVKRFPDEDDYELSSPAGAYLGTVYFAEDADKSGSHQTTYEVVDGQQRVTTVQIMLSVLYDYIQYYHDGEGAEDCSPGTFQDLTTSKEHLSDAFNRDGNPSVELSENENDYVKALAAKAERGRRNPARIEFIKNRLEVNSDITGKHHPRASQIKTLIEIFDEFQRYKPGKVSLEEQLVEELDRPDEEDEEGESAESEDGEDEEEANPEFSRGNEWIRLEKSHERLVEMYKRVYDRIDSETSDLNADQSAYYLSNLSEFLLNAMTVSRCTIEVPDSNLHMDIFKSINDKGQPLHGIDLIRARIRYSLAGASSNTVISDLNKMLTKFGGDKDKFRKMLEYYIAIDEDSLSTVSNASDELMNYFSRRNSNTSVEPRLSGGEDEIESRINDILDYAEYYYSMFDGDGDRFNALDNSISTTDKQDLRTILSRLEDSIGATQYRSLGAYACWRVGTESRIEEEAAGEFLKDVFNGSEVLTLRQSISDKSGQAIEGVYVETAHRLKLRLNELEEGEATVEDAFKGANVVDDIRTVAEDKEGSFFENGMVRAVIANTGWRNRQVRAVFHRMTQRLLREGDVELELRNVDELDIEHILPQKPISDNDGRSRSNGAVS